MSCIHARASRLSRNVGVDDPANASNRPPFPAIHPSGCARPWQLILLALTLPSSAFAFGPRTHREVTRQAVEAGLDRPDEAVGCPAGADVRAFLRWLHGEIASAGTTDAAEFARRWPRADAFDAFEAKSFLDLTRHPELQVAGVDFLPCDDDGSALGLVVTESVRPDEDGRNLRRLAFGPGRRPLVGRAGPVPEDPIVLDLGGLDGLASQAHAHYLLAEEPGGWLARGEVAPRLTSSPLALWGDPAHFAVATAVPGGPFTLGADMAMEHFLLALVALTWQDPAARRLSLAFLGHALHYVQDAADPLHTVQVGHARVAWQGVIAFAGRAVVTAGGYAGALQGPIATISDVVSNLHLWTEAFWDARGIVVAGEPWARGWAWTARTFSGDLEGALLAAWRAAEAGRARGPALYRAALRAVSPGVLEHGSVLKDGRFDAEALLEDDAEARTVTRIGHEAASVALAESTTVVQAYSALASQMGDPAVRRAVAALLATRVRAVAQREARLAAWRMDHPDGVPPRSGPVRMPAILGLELLAVLVVAVILVRRVCRPRS